MDADDLDYLKGMSVHACRKCVSEDVGWVTGTRGNSFLLKTKEATVRVEVKTSSPSKKNSLEVVPLETTTLPAQ